MNDLASAARDATFWAAVAEYAGQQARAAKERMELALDSADVQVEKFRVTDVDGDEMALIYTTQGRWSVQVTDLPALVSWVLKRHPSEIDSIPQIRPAYLEKIRKWAVDGAGVAADPTTGEVVPGITATQGSPYLTIRKTHLAKERAHRLLTDMASSGGYRLTQGDNHDPTVDQLLEGDPET